MAQTNMMRADEIAHGFNSVADRQYWRAVIAGTRINTEVRFNSRATMVIVSYRITTDDFIVTFAKSSVAFGDYMASAYRSLEQIMACLVAAGLPFTMPDEASAVLRLEYNPVTKATTVHLAHYGEKWPEALPFKVPQRENAESTLLAIDL